MHEYLPLLIVGATVGTFAAVFILAYALMKNKKEAIGFDRKMKDSEIVRRLLRYARPYWLSFVSVGLLMLFSIAYDIASPLLVGEIERLIQNRFELSRLWVSIAVYASILILSLVSTYFQSLILQKTGQRILSDLRESLFLHIEGLSHGQLNGIPVGTLVTRRRFRRCSPTSS